MYLADFALTVPGYNDGGPGYRIVYTGGKPAVSDSMETINAFLSVMAWESDADRTNAVAAAVTVLLRNHWPGGKPIILVTAPKSHAGKDTVLAFVSGISGSVSISYQATNWALERSLVGAIKTNPGTGMVVVENARLDRGDRYISSAILERFATDPAPMLFSTGTGGPLPCQRHRPGDVHQFRHGERGHREQGPASSFVAGGRRCCSTITHR